MPINNTEATGAAIAAPGSRPVYTADVVIIEILPDWRKQFVLTSRYVDTPALTWPQIAEALGLSLRQTYRMKNNAINDICKMTDGRVLAAVS